MATKWITIRIMVFILIVGGGATVNGKAANGQETAVSIDSILAAWKQRQERFQSAEIHWKSNHFIAKGGTVPDGQRSYGSVEGPIPPLDASAEGEGELTFAQDRIRYSATEFVWNAAIEECVTKTVLTVWDGKKGTTFQQRDARSRFEHKGSIYPDASQIVSRSDLTPLLIYYRPLLYEPYLRRFRISERGNLIDGTECIALRQGGAFTSTVDETLWLDPAIDYAMRRWTSTSEGKVVSQQDVIFTDHQTFGAVPMEWNYSKFDSAGKVRVSDKYVISDSRLNVQTSPDKFELAFPPNTLVSDLREGRDERGRVPKYIVRADKSTRTVVPGELERGATPEMLLSSEPGEAGLAYSTNWIWLVVLNIVLIAIVIGFLGLRLVSRRK